MHRRTLLRALPLLAVFLWAACTSQVRTKPAQLKVVAEPASAAVYVDERFVAVAKKLAETPVSLKPGKRRITVQANGYFPHDIVMELSPGVSTLEISLRPVPP